MLMIISKLSSILAAVQSKRRLPAPATVGARYMQVSTHGSGHLHAIAGFELVGRANKVDNGRGFRQVVEKAALQGQE